MHTPNVFAARHPTTVALATALSLLRRLVLAVEEGRADAIGAGWTVVLATAKIDRSARAEVQKPACVVLRELPH